MQLKNRVLAVAVAVRLTKDLSSVLIGLVQANTNWGNNLPRLFHAEIGFEFSDFILIFQVFFLEKKVCIQYFLSFIHMKHRSPLLDAA